MRQTLFKLSHSSLLTKRQRSCKDTPQNDRGLDLSIQEISETENSQNTAVGQWSRNEALADDYEVVDDAVWGDGNLTRTASEDYHQAAGPACHYQQPYLWGQPSLADNSQTEVETTARTHNGTKSNTSIQERGSVQAGPFTHQEYCFGMVSASKDTVCPYYVMPRYTTSFSTK